MNGRLQSVTAVLIGVLLAAVAQLMMKRGLERVGALELGSGLGSKIVSIATQPRVIFGLTLYGVSSVFYLFALSREDLSFVYPLLALNFVFIALLSKFVLNEAVSAIRLTGIFVVAVGVSLIAIKS